MTTETATKTGATNWAMKGNDEYFPKQGGLSEIYADTNKVTCTGIQVVSGFKFWQKGNRLAPAIYATNPDCTGGQWLSNDVSGKDDYFPNKSGLSEFYADTNPVQVPAGKVMIGFQFYLKNGNRLAPKILVLNADGRGQSDWVQNDDMSDKNYFSLSSEIYADTNELIFSPGNQVKGFMFWQKGNRIAPALLI